MKLKEVIFLIFLSSNLIICHNNDDNTEVSIIESEKLNDIPISNEISKKWISFLFLGLKC
jgi:hypothetical protein